MRYGSAMNGVASIALFAACSFSTIATACDGPDPGPLADRFASAEFVAVVRVTSLAVAVESPSGVDGVAEIVESLKGNFAGPVPVHGYVPAVDCWVAIDLGREYVVFLPDPAGQRAIWFSMFSKTTALEDVPAVLLRKWRTHQ